MMSMEGAFMDRTIPLPPLPVNWIASHNLFYGT